MTKLDSRIERIEVRVDEIKDDVSELKADFRIHTKLVEEHVMGDTKIITEIQPLLAAIPQITEMAEEHHYKKMKRKKRIEKMKSISLPVGLIATLVGLISGVMRLFGLL